MPIRNVIRRRMGRTSALLAALATALAGCSQEGPMPEPPVSEIALAAVVADPGVPREPLARAADDLFAAQDIGETHALLVLHNGEIVVERYRDGYDAETRFLGWSMAKNITAILTGMLVADGRLGLDSPAPIAAWQRPGDPRGGITPRHLLQMRSGLRDAQSSDPEYANASDRLLLLNGRDDMAGWAAAQPQEAHPGSTFQYSDGSIMILNAIAADLLAPDSNAQERQRVMQEFVEARLAVPLGMDSLVGEYDASGTLMGASHFWADARDWATFGEFLRQKGSVDGAQIVPRGWVDFMVRPSPAAPDYGATVWLNVDGAYGPLGFVPVNGVDNIYAGIGRFGQFIIISPDQGLVMVRLGITQRPDRARLAEEMADVLQLYPSG